MTVLFEIKKFDVKYWGITVIEWKKLLSRYKYCLSKQCSVPIATLEGSEVDSISHTLSHTLSRIHALSHVRVTTLRTSGLSVLYLWIGSSSRQAKQNCAIFGRHFAKFDYLGDGISFLLDCNLSILSVACLASYYNILEKNF